MISLCLRLFYNQKSTFFEFAIFTAFVRLIKVNNAIKCLSHLGPLLESTKLNLQPKIFYKVCNGLQTVGFHIKS